MFSQFGIGVRLFAAFLGIAMLSLSSGVAGWWILRDISVAQSRLTTEAIPAVAAAQETVNATTRMLTTGENLAAAASESVRLGYERDIIVLSLEIRRALADAALSRLEETSLGQLSGTSETLFDNLKEQNRLVKERLLLLEGFAARSERTALAATDLVDVAETLVSNASASAFAVVANLYGLIGPGSPSGDAYEALDRLIEQDIFLLDRMWELRLRSSQLALLNNRLDRAISREEVDALAADFQGHLRVIRRRVASIDDPIRRAQAEAHLGVLSAAAGELPATPSLFEDRIRLIAIGDELGRVAQQNRDLAASLNTVAQAVMTRAQQFARASSEQADRAVSMGLLALLAASAIAVLISGLIVWLYVERGVVRRLGELASAMNRLSGGDLDVQVRPGGTHELKALADAVTVFRDVSRQRQALEAERERTNEELRRHREALQDLVNERTLQLREEVRNHEEARDKAEQASRAKSDFLATMSHEIRTPMTGMLGMLRVLSDTDLSSGQKRQVLTATGAGEALLGILNSILDYSKIESGKMTVDPVAFSFRELLVGVADLMRPSAEEKGLRLTLSVSPDIAPWLSGDAGKIRQVVFNLVSNAIKFTPDGAVEIIATAASDGGGSQKLAIAVVDTGIGIPEDARQRIFDSFLQTDSSVTRRFGGTGLGLSISRGLAAIMSGTIDVESRPGNGSIFTFRLSLPVADAPPLARVAHRMRPGRPGSALRVLVVEDDEATRQVAAHFLKSMGHICGEARDGTEALSVAFGFRPEVILMDISMPEMDGITATSRLRELLRPDPVRVIAMSAHVFRQEVETYLSSGMDAYVAKPLSPETLASAIEAVLRAPSRAEELDEVSWERDLHDLGADEMRSILAVASVTLEQRLAVMHASMDRADLLKLKLEAHAARSTALAAGFGRLQTIFADLEEAARCHDIERCRSLVSEAEQSSTAALTEAELRLAGAGQAADARSSGTAKR